MSGECGFEPNQDHFGYKSLKYCYAPQFSLLGNESFQSELQEATDAYFKKVISNLRELAYKGNLDENSLVEIDQCLQSGRLSPEDAKRLIDSDINACFRTVEDPNIFDRVPQMLKLEKYFNWGLDVPQDRLKKLCQDILDPEKGEDEYTLIKHFIPSELEASANRLIDKL